MAAPSWYSMRSIVGPECQRKKNVTSKKGIKTPITRGVRETEEKRKSAATNHGKARAKRERNQGLAKRDLEIVWRFWKHAVGTKGDIQTLN